MLLLLLPLLKEAHTMNLIINHSYSTRPGLYFRSVQTTKKDAYESSSTQYVSPYQVDPTPHFMQTFKKSQMSFTVKQTLTYQQLLNHSNQPLLFELLDQPLLRHQLLQIQTQLQPQNMSWTIWRTSTQIKQFLQNIQQQIIHLNMVKQLQFQNGPQIIQTYNQLYNQSHAQTDDQNNLRHGKMHPNYIRLFIQWLNQISTHPYLRKNTHFLVFISHCLPIDKWNLLVYQQIYVRKPLGIIDKAKIAITNEKIKRKKLYFLTITSDGILKSDDHLLLSKVDAMIPFTNLMKIKQQRKGNNIIFNVSSGSSQSWQIDFHDDYVSAINFTCGLARARTAALYKQPYKTNDLKFKNLSSFDYSKKQEQNTASHRFNSFAPQRQKCAVKIYNDGCGYFEDLYGCLMHAKYQICITDWMLTPYFLLRRPGTIDDSNMDNRLDGVLLKAAQRGVKIFIILFMQPAMFVNNDSQGASKRLQKLHKNIKVYRHPNVAVPSIWSHHQKLCVIDQQIGFMGGLDICYGRWDTPEHRLVDKRGNKKNRLWDGCDFNNFRKTDIYNPREYTKSSLNQDFQVRMPWHDVALQMRGDVVIDLLRHFVQYWYFVKSQYKFSPRRFFRSFKNKQVNIRTHEIGKQIKQTTQQFVEERWQLLKEDITEEYFPGHDKRISQLLIEQRIGTNAGHTRMQMLRSANNWSIGADIDKPQRSIHEAYKQLIQQAEHHIYIENQFFMGLKNEIVKTLCERITRAFYEKKPFKVIIVVPLLPGFQGEPGDPSSTVLRIQIHWQKVAILTGQDSIYNTLQKTCPGINIPNYLFFFGLRKWDVLHGSPLTEIIYVHSKLMIVDDRRAICGSANINDRSLWGTGDSQIAVCIEEDNQVNSHLFDTRCRLFDEHFRLTKKQCKQITSEPVWRKLLKQTRTNTLIYRQVFGCVPDDEVTTHQQIDLLAQKATYECYKLNKIVGHAVQYPLKFMDDEDLTFSLGQKEYYAPVESFT